MTYFDHFSDPATTKIGQMLKNLSRKKMMRCLLPFIPSRECSILEIGPGFGEFASLFKENGFSHYTGVEPNPSLRLRLQESGYTVKDYLIPSLQEDDCSYDLIILIDVFEHLNGTPEATRFLEEVHRVLKPGGIVCIGCPDYLHWGSDFFNGDYSHSNISTVRRTVQLFHNTGIKTEKYFYLSCFLSGPLATVSSWFFNVALCFVRGNNIHGKLYKLKLTFIREFLIIGRKD